MEEYCDISSVIISGSSYQVLDNIWDRLSGDKSEGTLL